ncbi:DUF5011 domain-containing protein [Pseudoclavibacter sp. CFCC 13796]|uniref:immunoglobulin-like domain-containing protein n=1 Tax=Pseudoclavibacter sp. CFCC 13796 TaxID=2615179 RepID=UPI0013018BB2|nr:immunoglobulin-like domain-containing protein [Pseudoclavibacter sp. CFCC 13796]KAB1660773.1 DUF5011 domain-containing protein [Pseudoclavibacter sp. CFCC 13796]
MNVPLPAAGAHSGAGRRRTRLTAIMTGIALVGAPLVVGASFGTTAEPQAIAAEAVQPLLSTASTTWKYSDNNTDPAAGSADRLSWTTASFDDSKWKSGKGSFGAKHGAATGIGGHTANTLLTQYIGDSKDDVPTFHFRTKVNVTKQQLASATEFTGTALYDDGAQIFVNGAKVAGLSDERVEQAPEAQRNLMYAGSGASDPAPATFSVPSTALHEGENTIAVALYQDRKSSSDVYFDLQSLAPAQPEAPVDPTPPTDVVLTVGDDESQRRLNWYTATSTDQAVQVAKQADVTGDQFPADKAKTIAASAKGKTTSGEFAHDATITGLEPNTTYVYRVGSDVTGWAATETFATKAFSGDYEFLFFGDPQVGASGNLANDEKGWVDTVDVAEQTYPNSEMLFSAGDQVNTASREDEYDTFLKPKQMRQVPLVPVNGNHDVGSKAYEQHFSVPNWDQEHGKATSATASGGDYWFIYKDVLYVVLNSNNGDTASHKEFVDQVVKEQGAKAKWKVLAFHHSIYSIAAHVNDKQIKDLRAALPTIASDAGFDLVLQGHDHSYTRTYLIKDGELANPDETAAQGTVTAKPGEVLYVTANSASGSKYYDITAPDAWYASVQNQEKVRNYSHIAVTDDSITVKTLRSEQKGDDKPVNSVVDEVKLQKVDTTAPALTVPADGTIEQGAEFDPLDGVSAVDVRDGDLTGSVKVEGTVDTATPGAYTLTYTVTDAANNAATAKRTVTVAAKATPTPEPGEGTGEEGTGQNDAPQSPADQSPASAEQPAADQPAAEQPGHLAQTGATGAALAVGLLLAAAGAVTLIVRRRRA